jgi:transposase
VGKAGQATAELAQRILDARAHPEQGFRACMGIKRLGETYGTERLEAACRRALALQSFSYRSVKSILESGLEQKSLSSPASGPPPIEHENLRGADYYHHN